MAAETRTQERPGGECLQVLEAFDRVLAREAHVLRERPKILWQQMYNRLQWHGDAVADQIREAFRERSGAESFLWLHCYTPMAESEGLMRTLAGHAGMVEHCKISPDGDTVFSGASSVPNEGVAVWDARSGARRLAMGPWGPWGKDSPPRFDISPDGSWIVGPMQTTNGGWSLAMWDTRVGGHIATLSEEDALGQGRHVTGRLVGCAVSPDGLSVAATGEMEGEGGWSSGLLEMWDLATRTLKLKIVSDSRGILGSCAFSPDGRWLVSTASDMTLRIFDAVSGRELMILRGHTKSPSGHQSISDCAVSPDGTWIVSASDDQTLKVWDAASGECLRTLCGHTGKVLGCAISPDGAIIVSASEDMTLRVWDSTTGAELEVFAGQGGAVTDCNISPDASWIVSASYDGTLKIWHRSDGLTRRLPARHSQRVLRCAASPDGTWLVSASMDDTLKVWDTRTGEELATLRGHQTVGMRKGSVKGCAVSPDGSSVVSASEDATVKVWDAVTWAQRMSLSRPFTPPAGGGMMPSYEDCAIAPDGSWFVTANTDSSLTIWDTSSGAELATLASRDPSTRSSSDGCAVSPDGSWILSLGHTVTSTQSFMGAKFETLDYHYQLWDVRRRRESRRIELGQVPPPWNVGSVKSGAVSPDGGWFVTAGSCDGLWAWDLVTGQKRNLMAETPEAGWESGPRTVSASVISPDAAFVASIGTERTIWITDASTGHRYALLVPPAPPTAIAWLPAQGTVAYGDSGGGVHFARLIGLPLGPLVVTAIAESGGPLRGAGLTARCPACRESFPVATNQLGTELTCPNPACARALRLNQFTLP